MLHTKIKGIPLVNGHTIQPVVLDCCLGTTGEGPPGLFGAINRIDDLNRIESTIVLKSITRHPKIGNFGAQIFKKWWFNKEGWAKSGFWGIPFPKKFCYLSIFGKTRNSFGLTNKGFDHFLQNDWQTIVKNGIPVIISIFIEFGGASKMEIQQAYSDAEYMMQQIKEHCDPRFLIAVIFNASCPNVKAGVCEKSDAIVECASKMKQAAPGIPLGVKLSFVQPVELGVRLHKVVDFIQGINTIPFNVIYPDKTSLLSHIGGGGISGPEITSRALEYVTKLRELIPDAKIIGGGGISNMSDAYDRFEVSDSIAVGILVKNPNIVNDIIANFK